MRLNCIATSLRSFAYCWSLRSIILFAPRLAALTLSLCTKCACYLAALVTSLLVPCRCAPRNGLASLYLSRCARLIAVLVPRCTISLALSRYSLPCSLRSHDRSCKTDAHVELRSMICVRGFMSFAQKISRCRELCSCFAEKISRCSGYFQQKGALKDPPYF
jgi:hypothetical protein